MLKIGDFSKLANVTVKTLRYYASLGLLRPAWIDRFTGYRYYGLEQLPRLNRILALKDLGLSLEQVQRVLDNQLSPEELRGMLHLKQAELQQKLIEEQMRLKRVEARLNQIASENDTAVDGVVLRSIEPMLVAYRSINVPTHEQLPESRAAAQSDIEAWLHRENINPPGPWMLIYTGGEYLEQNIPVEVAVGLDKLPRAARPRDGRVLVRMLPGLAQAAIYALAGPQESLAQAYTTLYQWIEANRFRAAGLAREITWTDAETPGGLDWDDTGSARPGDQTTKAVTVLLPVEPITYPNAIEETKMEPEIIEFREMIVAGPVYEGDNKNQEIAVMWEKEFNPNVDKIQRADETMTFGVCEMDDTLPDGSFRYVAGVEINRPEDAPSGFYQIHVPAGKYAAFKHIGALEGLSKTYEYIYQVWLPKSGYKRADRPDLEVYTDEFRDFEPESVLHLWVPIE